MRFWGLPDLQVGILTGVFFLNKGYTLKRTYRLSKTEGFLFPAIQSCVFHSACRNACFYLTLQQQTAVLAENTLPSSSALLAGLIVGALAQRTRLCMVGGIRDMILFCESKLLLGFLAILVSALVCNFILTAVTSGTLFPTWICSVSQLPILTVCGIFWVCIWTGFGCVLLGGCPLRQLVLSGEGNSDSAITVIA